ncbi:GNAT family N-acetyltransferase [Brevibacillus sp. IT-7CA2]|uniref:GNAT family N-acetyltransferase n=1 Tax=Brevibacillus sp. IT-7CA2 TaxID=3026436 RepID=UPI0039E1B744
MTTPLFENYTVYENTPSVEDYVRLRKQAGLSEKAREAAEIGLKNTVFAVTLFHEETAIGMGRIIGDGGCFYQIVDIAVVPEHQKKGLGKVIMQHLMDYLDKNAPKTAYVSLIADVPADKLYEQFGFAYTAPRSVGMYKWFK